MDNLNFEILKVNQYVFKHRNELNKEIGGVIKKIRKNQNMSVEELSIRSITSPSYINQIENGVNGITLNKFILICNSLKIESREILDNFLLFKKIDDDVISEELQNGKSLSKNILEFMKKK